MGCHHKLEEYLDAYIAVAGIVDDKKSPLFRAAVGRTGSVSVGLMFCGILLQGAPKPIALTANMTSVSAPPGATVQLQIFLDVPTALTSGSAVVKLDPTIFGAIVAADVYSSTGDQTGSATINGTQVDVEFGSQTGGVGRSPALPLMTITTPVLSTATAGSTATITFQPGSTAWQDINGVVYDVSVGSGTVTVGGTASIGAVAIQGGLQAAGTVVEVDGTGFTPNTTASIDGVAISNVAVLSAQTIDITLAAAAILDFRRVAVKVPTSSEVSFYPVVHGTSSAVLAVQPIFPLELFGGGAVGGFVLNNGAPTYYALQNISGAPASIGISNFNAACASCGTTNSQVTLAPGATMETSYTANTFWITNIFSNSPIRIAQVAKGKSIGMVEPMAATVSLNGGIEPVQWTVGTALPNLQEVTVFGNGSPWPIPFTVAASSTGGWLGVSPAQGVTCTTTSSACPAAQLTISINPSQLAPGTYTGTVTVLPNGVNPQPLASSVTLTVLAAHTIQTTGLPAVITELPSNLGAQTFNVPLATSDGAAAFTVSSFVPSGQQWLSVSPLAGQAPATVAVTVDGTKLSGTSDKGTITIQGPANMLALPVTLAIYTPPPVLSAAQTSPLIFYGRTGGPAPPSKTIEAGIVGGISLSSQTTSGGNWLSASLTSAGVPEPIVRVTTTGLTSGTYQGTVTVSSSSTNPVYQPSTIPVVLNIQDGQFPAIQTAISSVSIAAVVGAVPISPPIGFSTGQIDLPVNITASTSDGGNWLGFRVNVPQGGIAVPPYDTPGNFTVVASPQLVGSYSGTITLTAAADPHRQPYYPGDDRGTAEHGSNAACGNCSPSQCRDECRFYGD